MSVLEEIKALEAKRTALLEGAKAELIEAANKIITELRELGFSYSLTLEKQTPKGRKAGSTNATTDDKETREKKVTELLAKHPDGLFASEIFKELGATDDAAKVRINNDLQALGQGKTGSKKIKQVEATADRLLSLLDPVTKKKPPGKQPKLWVLTKQD